MKCEIEFLAVGDASRAGDCIVVRYGTEADYSLMVVDGGTADTGEKLVAHIKAHFGAGAVIEHVVLTHSDNDHASGLRELLRQLPVRNLWLHVPWLHASDTISLFHSKNWSVAGLQQAIKQEYGILEEIIDAALAQNTHILEPFQGAQIGPFVVLSPRKIEYQHLLPQFEKTPEADKQLLESKNFWFSESGRGFTGILSALMEKAQELVPETWTGERLKDGGVTSASNESSVILYGQFDDNKRVLLTGDAGNSALTWAANFAISSRLPLQQFSFVQVPHHGSRRNVGPTVLNTLLGPIVSQGTSQRFTAYVSAPASDEKHPRKIVLNAFMRRGGKVYITQGQNKIHYGGFARRSGYGDVEPVPFATMVEQYD